MSDYVLSHGRVLWTRPGGRTYVCLCTLCHVPAVMVLRHPGGVSPRCATHGQGR